MTLPAPCTSTTSSGSTTSASTRSASSGPLHEHRDQVRALTDTLAERFAVGTGDGCLPGGIDLETDEHVHGRQHAHEVVVKVSGPRVAVRLVTHHEPSLWPHVPGSADDGLHLGGVVAVVVHHGELRAIEIDGLGDLKTSAHAAEPGEPGDDRVIAQPLVRGDRHRRQRVQNIVTARDCQLDVEARSVRPADPEVPAAIDDAHVLRPVVALIVEAVGEHGS